MVKKRYIGRLTSFIFSYYKIIILISVLVILIGVYFIRKISIELAPARSDHVVTIVTYYPDIESSRIVDVVTKPLERALKSVQGVKDIYSFSSRGKSRIVCYFNTNENIDEFIVRLTDRIYHVKRGFPREVHTPLVYRYNTDDSPMLIGSISSGPMKKLDDEMTSFVYEKLKPDLLSIEGVANVQISGLDRYEYLIELNPEAIKGSNLDYQDILKYLIANNLNIYPGNFKTKWKKTPIKLLGRYENIKNIQNSRVRYGTNSIDASDLLSVKRIKKSDNRFSMVNERRAILVYLYKKSDSSVLNIQRAIRKKLKDYTGNLQWKNLYSQAEELDSLLKRTAIIISIGLLLVAGFLILICRKKLVLVLLIFISTIFSSLGAVVTIFFTGATLNIVGILGLIVGAGLSLILGISFLDGFVGNFSRVKNRQIIDVGNIKSIKKSNFKNTEYVKCETDYMLESLPLLPLLIEEAFKKSAGIIFATTVSAIMVGIPLIFFGNEISSKLWITPYKDFQLVIFFMSVWVLLSLFFLMPSLIFLLRNRVLKALLRGYQSSSIVSISRANCINKLIKFRREIHLSDRAKEILSQIRFGFNVKAIALLILFLLTIVSFYMFLHMDRIQLILGDKDNNEFFYQFNSGFNQNYRVIATSEIVKSLLKAIDENKRGIYKSDGSLIVKSRSILTSTLEGDRVRFHLISSGKNRHIFENPFKSPLKGASSQAIGSILELMKKSRRKDGFFYTGKRYDSTIDTLRVMIFGEDLKRVNKLSDLSSKKIFSIPGVMQILKGYREGTDELAIVPDMSDMNFHGLSNNYLESFLRYIFYRPVILKYYNGERVEDVRAGIKIESEFENASNFLKNVQMPLREGMGFIRLMDVANVFNQKASSEISRKNGKPYISLDIKYLKIRRGSVLPAIDNLMKKQPYRLDEYYTIIGNSEGGIKGNAIFLLSFLMSMFLIWLIMSFILKSFKKSVVVFILTPIGFFGIILFSKINGNLISVSSEIAAMVLVVVSVNYGFLIINGFLGKQRDANFTEFKVDRNFAPAISILGIDILLVNSAIFLLIMIPMYILMEGSSFYGMVSGSILFSLCILLIFLLAIFFFLCIINKTIIIKKHNISL